MRRVFPVIFALFLALGSCTHSGASGQNSSPSAGATARAAFDASSAQSAQLDLITTYCIYAKSLWKNADAGGYWGDGIDPKANGNGAVRGTSCTMLAYALLAHEMHEDRLDAELVARLHAAGLTREELIQYVREDLIYLVAHYSAGERKLQPTWGESWQSAMWISFMGTAAILTWDDLPGDLKKAFVEVCVVEADRVASKPPKNYKPGDTGAEENAWDMSAPAVALALVPRHGHANQWWRALCVYCVNTFSAPADRTSKEVIGANRVRDLVSTTNIFADLTLENHGFFHPDYIQACVGMLGETRMTLALGDQRNGTDFAARFEPYAMRHVADIWRTILRPIYLPSGEMTFPCGTDWTVNTGQEQGCLAAIVTMLGDPAAIEAEKRIVRTPMRHRALSPAGRVLGDTNLEWFWEPILVQRMAMGILQHETAMPRSAEAGSSLDEMTATQLLPDAKVWMRRSRNYFASAAWGKKKTGTFTPFDRGYRERPYLTYPTEAAIWPAEALEFESARDVDGVLILSVKLADGSRAALVCFEKSVLWLSAKPLRTIGIENDRLSGGHTLYSAGGNVPLAPLMHHEPVFMKGPWMNIDQRLGMIAASDSFTYTVAGVYNRRAASVDWVGPASAKAWQMVGDVSAEQTRGLAGEFEAVEQAGVLNIKLRDGVGGRRFSVTAPLDAAAASKDAVRVQAID